MLFRSLGKIELQYNGIQQEIVLESYAQDAIWLRGKVISRDTTLTGEKPFLIYDSLYVMPDVTLTLEKNVRFFIHDKTDILIDGTLICNGERNTPVVFRGERTDRLFSNLPYDEMASQWGGMRITENSYDNRMSFTEFRGASKGLVLDSADVNRMKLTIESSKFKLAGSDLLNAECVKMEVSNSLFTNSAGALISLNGGDYRFTHCTLANLFNQGSINNMALHLNNYKLDNNAVPQPLDLTRAEFNNCIIWGKRDLEVNLDSAFLNKPVDALYNFRFDHCLIKARGENDDKFISTVWNENPEFIDTGEEYFFDYHKIGRAHV